VCDGVWERGAQRWQGGLSCSRTTGGGWAGALIGTRHLPKQRAADPHTATDSIPRRAVIKREDALAHTHTDSPTLPHVPRPDPPAGAQPRCS